MVPGKLLAFAGPTAVAKHFWGYRTFTPEDYHQYFADTGMTAVVRLNNEVRASSCHGGWKLTWRSCVHFLCPAEHGHANVHSTAPTHVSLTRYRHLLLVGTHHRVLSVNVSAP